MERLPGFRDFYPEPLPAADLWSADARAAVFDSWRQTARCYGFREYDGPPLEPLELYTLKSGDEIIGQLYNFTDKGDRPVALRPEMTPTLARMAAAYERNYKKPIKWFAVPQLFRYERQQKGRLREHFQFNADVVGEAGPAADAELIALLIDSLRNLGLSSDDFRIRLSSRDAWEQFFVQHASGTGSEAMYAFFQVVDKLEREAPEQSHRRLVELGLSLEAVREFIAAAIPTTDLEEILANLRARGLDPFVEVDYGVVRGLAYYTGTVFEAFDRKGEFRAIAGGGRYDNLLKLVSKGKVDLPAIGFGMGDVVLSELLQARGLAPSGRAVLDLFVLVEEESLRPESLRLVQRLREAGTAVDYAFGPMKPEKQFKRARELGAAHSVCLGRDESGHLTARVRDLHHRGEEHLSVEAVVSRFGRAPQSSMNR